MPIITGISKHLKFPFCQISIQRNIEGMEKNTLSNINEENIIIFKERKLTKICYTEGDTTLTQQPVRS